MRFTIVLAAALAVLAAGCGSPSESRGVADRFMELYYARANLAEAVTLCAGAARARLEGEIKNAAGAAPDSGADRPRVSFELEKSTTTPSEASYVYRVTAHTPDVGIVAATLTLVDANGRWLVTTLDETEAPPGS